MRMRGRRYHGQSEDLKVTMLQVKSVFILLEIHDSCCRLVVSVTRGVILVIKVTCTMYAIYKINGQG